MQSGDRQKKDQRQARDQDIQRDLVRRLLALRAFHQRNHLVEECLAGIRGNADLDLIGKHLGAARNGARSPPDSRMTGALSPVITDSSTVAMPSITSPSPGIRSPVSAITISPERSFEAETVSILPFASKRLAMESVFVFRRFGLRLAARFRHGFREVGEQHREPEPDGNLDFKETSARARANRSRNRNNVVSAAPTSTTKMTGFFAKVSGFSLMKNPSRRAARFSGSKSGRERGQFRWQQRARIDRTLLTGMAVVPNAVAID